MRLLIAVHDLTDSNRRLMPWRTVCEVTEGARQSGHAAAVLSLGNAGRCLSGDNFLRDDFSGDVIQVNKSKRLLAGELEKVAAGFKPDVVFWPVAWREAAWRIGAAGSLRVPVVGYFPGGAYSLPTALNAARQIGVKRALPYVREAAANKKKQVRRLKAGGFERIIAMTGFTAQQVIWAGYEKSLVYAIPPGKDAAGGFEASDLPEDFNAWLSGRPFYLFMGPPARIRGVFEMLEAFDRAADKHPDVCLVCLFRPDSRLDASRIERKINALKYRHRVYPVWEMLDEKARNGFLSRCFALVQPFVVVPSEIPLAIIENMAWGKPVVVSDAEGTGEFAQPFGLVVRPGNTKALAEAMRRLLADENLYAGKAAQAKALYEKHPDWAAVAEKWVDAAASLWG